jgi:hypothetical protein
MTKIYTKRRIATKDEFLLDMKKHILDFFNAFEKAKFLAVEEVSLTPPEARVRNLPACIANSKMVQCLQERFGDRFGFGKYKRIVGKFHGYQLLIKKVRKNGMPMSISTKMTQAIMGQLLTSLFDDNKDTQDALVFFGYQTDKWGQLVAPQFICIEDSKILWRIRIDDIAEELTSNNVIPTNLTPKDNQTQIMPKLKNKGNSKTA